MRFNSFAGIAVLAMVSGGALGQTKLPLQQAIEAQYPITKPTADHKDMVTAGAVIDLMKDNLVMYSVETSAASSPTTSTMTYKEGKFSGGSMGFLAKAASRGATRTFVAGEKFWLIGVNVKDDSVQMEFLSDPISDIRYKAFVKYPFPKGAIPTPDVMLATIKETIKAESTDDKGGGQPAASAAPAPAPVAAPAPKMADIPPPPPPMDAPPAAPKSISLGQTKDQVVANFGPPSKVVTLPTKEIDTYPDMKVTFVKGKVTDVQ